MKIQPIAPRRHHRGPRRRRRARVFIASCLAVAVGLVYAALFGIPGIPSRSIGSPAVPTQVRIQKSERVATPPGQAVYRPAAIEGTKRSVP